MSQYWVYVVRCSDGSLYTGVTLDLARRLAQHNAGLASKYTRSRRPVRLAYSEIVDGKGPALKRELEIKGLSRSAKLLLCKSLAMRGSFSFR